MWLLKVSKSHPSSRWVLPHPPTRIALSSQNLFYANNAEHQLDRTQELQQPKNNRIELDKTSLIWAQFLRSGHMHCGTGRPTSQRMASKCFKPPEIAWNSLPVSGPNIPTICLSQTNHTRKKVGIFDQYVGSALFKVDPDMDLPTLISSVLGPLAFYMSVLFL